MTVSHQITFQDYISLLGLIIKHFILYFFNYFYLKVISSPISIMLGHIIITLSEAKMYQKQKKRPDIRTLLYFYVEFETTIYISIL